MSKQKCVYFLSDSHLGSKCCPQDAADKFLSLLYSIQESASGIYLVGDIFDFWIDYNSLIRSEFIDILHALRTLNKNGVDIHYIKGNHDFSLGKHFREITGCYLHQGRVITEIQGQKVIIEHGNGFLRKQGKDNLLLKILENPAAQWCYKLIPPGIGISIAQYISGLSRDASFTGISPEERKMYIEQAGETLSDKGADIIILGHTHYPEIYRLYNSGTYMNIGDMCENLTYGRICSGKAELLHYNGDVITPQPCHCPADHP
ncbi:MAG: UDP-2,3-diacylglucosamine diphosphatase [Chitinivibrionales bacterium]